MEKSIVKKKLRLKPEEKKYVARMIDNGGSLQDVHWTYLLLQSLAVTERMKEPLNQCDEIQKMCFSSRYWAKFMQRKNLNLSGRKSDQIFFPRLNWRIFN